MSTYQSFLASKQVATPPSGFVAESLSPQLFEFQRDITRWSIDRGRAAIFADCGLGKTPMQLQWAESVTAKFNKPVLILAPLAVSKQTEREGQKFGIPVTIAASDMDIRKHGIFVTNYEKLQHFDPSRFAGVVLDESSILKSFNGATRNILIDRFSSTPMKLCATATPAPNDFMELGNHSEFFGVLTRTEMLSMFFVHDGGDTAKWRLKGHAEEEYWKWICGWAVMIRKPSDLGYSDAGFELPPLKLHHVTVESGKPMEGFLFPVEAQTLEERRNARRVSIDERVRACWEVIKHGENQRAVKGIQPALSPTAQSRAEREGAGVVSPEQGQDRQEPAQGIHESLSRGEPGQMATHARTAGRGKQEKAAEIRQRYAVPGETEGSCADLSQRQAGYEEGATVKEIRDHGGRIQLTDHEAERTMCDLSPLGSESKELLSPGGPLPRDEEDTGLVVHELQSRVGEVQGFNPITSFSHSLSGEQWIVWCGLNAEQDAIAKLCGNECVSIYGSLTEKEKEDRLDKWLRGEKRILISKVSIFGYGLNLQQCHNVVFLGLSDSYEAFYQAVRRCWRFGQIKPVNCYVISSEQEGAVVKNIERKERDAMKMAKEMVKHMSVYNTEAVRGTPRTGDAYEAAKPMALPGWITT
jgi:hypothetical protein